MISLEICATIATSKMLEFNQSKLIFIDRLQNFEGYAGFKEKAGEKFVMQIDWESRKTMDAFVDSEDYRFFHGAIITLSKKFNTHIIDDNKDNAYPLKK
jgi:hypothetical protein